MSRAILLVDHGSRRPASNAQLHELASAVRARVSGTVVEVAHLELARPTIAEGIEACVRAGAKEIVVHPWFLGPGRHTTHDIPRKVEEALAAYDGVDARISSPLGLHPKLVDVVIDRIDEGTRVDPAARE